MYAHFHIMTVTMKNTKLSQIITSLVNCFLGGSGYHYQKMSAINSMMTHQLGHLGQKLILTHTHTHMYLHIGYYINDQMSHLQTMFIICDVQECRNEGTLICSPISERVSLLRRQSVGARSSEVKKGALERACEVWHSLLGPYFS